MTKKILLLLSFFLVAVFTVTIAQEEESSYKDNLKLYKYKKHQWEVGVHGGHLFVAGDVKPELGWGAGIHIRKAIDFAFSLRLDAMYGQARGLEPEMLSPTAISQSPELTALGYDGTKLPWYPNFRSDIWRVSLQGVFNLNSFNFNQQLKRWNFYLLAGGGINGVTANYDAADGNGAAYDFSAVADGLDQSLKDDRKDIADNVDAIIDRDYETEVGRGVPTDGSDITWHGNFGGGISFKISKSINLSLEHQILVVFGSEGDNLDGYRFENTGSFTQSTDWLNYTSLRLNFNIGSTKNGDRLEPLYWVGPLDLLAQDVAEVAERVDKSLRDSDGDGVFDMFDQEEDTPEGVAADTRGVTLDSDGDGVADYQDKEPFSPPGYEVDGDGVAQVPDPGYTTEPDVNRIVDAKLAEFRNSLPTPQMPSWFLPLVNFGFDSYTVRQSEYGKLHQIAMVLQQNDNLRLVVRGHADRPASDCYNQVLSYNRAESTINYLVSKYGIARNRLMVDYAGEAEAIIDTNGASLTNRRVEFRVAQASDTGDKAKPDCGVNKAGRGKKEYGGNRQGF